MLFIIPLPVALFKILLSTSTTRVKKKGERGYLCFNPVKAVNQFWGFPFNISTETDDRHP